MNKQTPFVKGNKWAFSSENQPTRKVTPRQLYKRAIEVLSMDEKELCNIVQNENVPKIIVNLANSLLNAQTRQVLLTIQCLENAQTGKDIKNNALQ